MTPLLRALLARIAKTGPLTVAEYMAEALGNPDHGYYMTRDPLGRSGDFITSPEISQMFGEMIGVWCVDIWFKMGQPPALNLVELGPGRGTLMMDVLRVVGTVEGMTPAVTVLLVETSPPLIQRQQRTLRESAKKTLRWCHGLDQVPEGPAIILANEFFDALPIHQLTRTADGWRERLIGDGGDGKSLAFTLSGETTDLESLIPASMALAPEGNIVEVGPMGRTLMAEMSERLVRHGGAALIVDYGPAASTPGDSLQAVRDHRYHDCLEAPGTADLTAHVDFATLAAVAQAAGARFHGPVGQGDFLTTLGIVVRAGALANVASPEQKEDIASALARLTAEDQMGTLFKAMAVTHPDMAVPAGFGASGP